MSSTLQTFWTEALLWTGISALLALDFLVSNRLAIYILPKFLAPMITVFLEGFVLFVTSANSLYCFYAYLLLIARKPAPNLTENGASKLKKVPSSSQNVSAASSNVSSSAILDVSGVERTKNLSLVSTFLENFFSASISKSNFSGSELSPPLNSRYSGVLNKDTSLSSTVGYHESPLNRSLSSIYTQQQLDKLLAEDTCDSVTDASTNLFANSFCDEERFYRAGTATLPPEKIDDAAKQVEQFVLSKQQSEKASRKSSFGGRKISESLNRFARESSPLASAGMGPMLGAGGSGGKQRRHESELLKVFVHYKIRVEDVEEYELKLRVWICNTIFRPLVEKIDEMNRLLAGKFASLHLKIGATSLDAIKTNLSSRVELCNTFLPFILPYLRVHSNQSYLVQRIRTLAENVALEEFRWNGGGAETIYDEADGFSKSIPWTERLPTDSEIVWFAFCAYMDYHLAPCPNYITGEFFKPFSNVYFLKADAQPTALHTSPEAFFIRLVSEHPPVFEFVFDGGFDVVVPNKESGNLWLVMVLFLAHVEKYNHSRIGHLHLSAISLDILDN